MLESFEYDLAPYAPEAKGFVRRPSPKAMRQFTDQMVELSKLADPERQYFGAIVGIARLCGGHPSAAELRKLPVPVFTAFHKAFVDQLGAWGAARR
jgi:hypothetical protein